MATTIHFFFYTQKNNLMADVQEKRMAIPYKEQTWISILPVKNSEQSLRNRMEHYLE